MKVLVTGGAGFIGSAVCRYLVGGLELQVLNIDKLTYAADQRSLDLVSGDSRYTFLKADVCDREALRMAFAQFQPNAVIHLAAESHVDRSINASLDFIQTNVVGTHSLLEVARGYWLRLPDSARVNFRFLHVSTDEVYGSLGATGLFSEVTAYDPSSPYSASKAASDHIALAWHRTYRLPVLVSNCSNSYGPFQFPEKLIPLLVINAIEGKPLPIYGDGSNVRDWLYVEDHARALWALLQNGRPGEKYNIGGRSEQTNLSVAEQICALMDLRRPTVGPHRRLITFVPDRPGHDFRYAIDPGKIETETGWRAVESFSTGIAKTVDWYLDNATWWTPLRDGYRGERLGLLSERPAAGQWASP